MIERLKSINQLLIDCKRELALANTKINDTVKLIARIEQELRMEIVVIKSKNNNL